MLLNELSLEAIEGIIMAIGHPLEGQDLHMETAKAMFETDEPTDEMRQFAKQANFYAMYARPLTIQTWA